MNTDPKISNAEFANSLQVGDKWESVLRDRYNLQLCGLVVERMTEASLWISGQRYSRKTGEKIGRGYCGSIPRPSSAKDIAEARREIDHARFWRALAAHDWRGESLETLREVGKLIKSAKENREASNDRQADAARG